MYLTATDAFGEVTWPSAMDATHTWAWDSAHCPRPICALAAEGVGAWYEAAFGWTSHAVNGYVFMDAATFGGGSTELKPLSEIVQIWEQERLPPIQQMVEELRDAPYETMSAAELAGEMPKLIRRSAEGFALTIRTSQDMTPALTQYLTFCARQWRGEGPIRGMRMIQGYPNATTDSARALQQLAKLANSPELKGALKAGDLEALRTAKGGGELAEGFDEYLRTYGMRLPSWMQLEKPTWAELPRIPMGMAAGYLDEGAAGPDQAVASAAAARDAEIAAAEAEMNDEDVAEFRRVREAAKDYVFLIEGRALWQQQLFGVLRVPAMILGRKLVEMGALYQPDDAVYLTSKELLEAATEPGSKAKETCRARQTALAGWGTLIPPMFLGEQPAGRPDIAQVLMDGAGLFPDGDEKIVNGFGASPGVVQGTARVVLDIADIDRVEPGDILVTVFTAPTWSPAFGIASAVVTDSGGVLSHAAIAAREYALPAVVGTQVGTKKIPDGASITVDGVKGIVRIDD